MPAEKKLLAQRRRGAEMKEAEHALPWAGLTPGRLVPIPPFGASASLRAVFSESIGRKR